MLIPVRNYAITRRRTTRSSVFFAGCDLLGPVAAQPPRETIARAGRGGSRNAERERIGESWDRSVAEKNSGRGFHRARVYSNERRLSRPALCARRRRVWQLSY